MNAEAHFVSDSALIHIFDRWHFCILRKGETLQIDTLNFANPARLESLKQNFFKDAPLQNASDWPEGFEKEVSQKILEKGEGYRAALEADMLNLIVGFTTDTLTAVSNEPERIGAIVDAIQELMEQGNSSAYLRFSAVYRVNL